MAWTACAPNMKTISGATTNPTVERRCAKNPPGSESADTSDPGRHGQDADRQQQTSFRGRPDRLDPPRLRLHRCASDSSSESGRLGRTSLQVAPGTGAPRIELTGGTFFGDIKVRHRRLWEKLGRHGQTAE